MELPLRHGQVAFNPTVQFENEYLSVDSDGRRESDQSVDLRHTTHSLKRQLRLQRCKLALICLLVALLLSSAVAVVVVLGKVLLEVDKGDLNNYQQGWVRMVEWIVT